MKRIMTFVLVSGAVVGCHVDSTGAGASGDPAAPRVPVTVSQKLDPDGTCPGGGVKVVSGFDADADGKLSEAEAKSSAVFCADPAILRLVKVSAEGAGAACPAGGQKVEIGLDNGDGGGTASDGELQSGEVDSTTYVCNGAPGSKGADGANGIDGVNGADGKDGANGVDGKDGANGVDGKDGTNGADGKDGTNGADGKDGTNGVDGKDGADGKDLVHMKVYDASNHFIGEAMTFWATGVAVRTPAGNIVDINWDGSFLEGEIGYDAAACAGDNRWLMSPSPTAYTFSNLLVWEATTGNLYKVDDTGAAGGMASSVLFAGASYWGWGDCYPTGDSYGWPLSPITRTEAGLPETFSAPLRLVP